MMTAKERARSRAIAATGAAAFTAILLSNCLFQVDQATQAVVVRFGEVVRTVNAVDRDPGLKFKLPWEGVLKLDRRNQALEADKTEITAADHERLEVQAYMRYRIVDPVEFYRALHDDHTADDRLQALVDTSLRQVLGTASSQDVVSGRRAALMDTARRDVADRARREKLGIEVMDLRLDRVDLPAAGREAAQKRMQAAFQQQATEIRGGGQQQKREIMAGADRDVAITLADATAEAEKLRGEGEARRATLLAHAFGRDPAFAAFYQSLGAYDSALGTGDTTLVLSPQSRFLKLFENGPGGGGK